jgi:hypothetical protein
VLINNFWDIDNDIHGVGGATPVGVNSVTKAQLITSTFPTTTANSSSGSSWDFDAAWLLVSGESPILRSTGLKFY